MTTQTPRTPASNNHSVTLSIADVMTRQPHTVGRDQTLAIAHQMMLKYGVRHLPVLENGHLVGILTQRDLYFLETIAGVDLTKDLVEDAMTPDCYTVAGNEKLSAVAAKMAERKLGSAVVMEDGHVVGIFTATDALRWIGER